MSAGNRASTQQETRSRETPRPPGPQLAGSRRGPSPQGAVMGKEQQDAHQPLLPQSKPMSTPEAAL